jgi:Ca-activated chloride channel family protein
VSADEREAARAFADFVRRPAGQDKAVRAGFRPVAATSPGVAVARTDGTDPDLPRTVVDLPSGALLRRMVDRWSEERKGARVMLVVDVSGSMAEDAAPGQTKLALARSAVEQSLGSFRGDDLVGLRQFSTGLGPAQDQEQIDLAPVAPVADQADRLRQATATLVPANGTPLYAVTRASVREMVAAYDPARINAVVLLTDGRNEDGDTADDKKARDDLVRYLQTQTQGENGRPVRLFTIGYGGGADAAVLQEMAEATNGRYYGATTDPTTIAKVFVQVVSNF